MEEWFYVKNDLIESEDIKEIIQHPIWSRFGLRRPKVVIDQNDEACQKAFSNVCAFISTRDIVQEHIAYRVWQLVENWDMPKDTTAESTEGGLIRLKYTFRFRDRFDEPNDDWLKSIEAISDELLGPYSKAEDNALSAAFGGRGKKRLNRVFDAISFIYPDYHYLPQGQGRKSKTTTSAPAASATAGVSKSKKMKVLTHPPRYIEPAMVPDFVEGATSPGEARRAASTTQSIEDPTVMPKTHTVKPVEDKVDKAEESRVEEIIKMPKILSPPTEAKLPKVQKASAATPKKRRMANVLDVVLEITKALSPAPTKKIAEATKMQAEAETGQAEAEATQAQAEAEARPSVPTEMEPVALEEKTTEQIAPEKIEAPAPKASNKNVDYIVMLRERNSPKKKYWRPDTTPKD
jgi:hypothetical protein